MCFWSFSTLWFDGIHLKLRCVLQCLSTTKSEGKASSSFNSLVILLPFPTSGSTGWSWTGMSSSGTGDFFPGAILWKDSNSDPLRRIDLGIISSMDRSTQITISTISSSWVVFLKLTFIMTPIKLQRCRMLFLSQRFLNLDMFFILQL